MGPAAIARQHAKGRMTVWERIRVLTPEDPTVLFQNWGPNLDGASLVKAWTLIALPLRIWRVTPASTVRVTSLPSGPGRRISHGCRTTRMRCALPSICASPSSS